MVLTVLTNFCERMLEHIGHRHGIPDPATKSSGLSVLVPPRWCHLWPQLVLVINIGVNDVAIGHQQTVAVV